MSFATLSFTLAFVALAMVLSLWLKLGVERDLLIATVRATIQLIIVGYILKFVFDVNNAFLIIAMVLLIILVATLNARSRAKAIPGVWWRIAAGLVITEVVTLGVLLGLHVVPFQPRYVITISGMIVGNAMVAAGVLLNRLQAEATSQRAEIDTVLALGGTPRQAIWPHLKQAIRAGLIPTIDSTKTTGLVQLPGMMTGQIIAGADPVVAIRYQLMILFCILAGSAVTSIVIGFLTYPRLFTKYQQLAFRGQRESV
ncbi:ABC transporter permease [Alicyclobacillus dauci]|uniref:Iron export ABC transporter permease subunit FetB n=1 Tax=Alicyclobacillus dauci TaxID=1475485 RepID=A0ABY6Z1Z2_9BACL|nr:iron export ABC transporter permease subunit FetB [Alicyclobacillus dauci]WAH36923.1 iron export ABC transporter permease subunit FetB [Alicyclobacillus dauci]